MTIADWLAERFPKAKMTTLRRMVANGRVTVNGSVVKQFRTALPPEATVELATATAIAEKTLARSGTSFATLYEDAEIWVVQKPPGLLTSTTPREKRPTLFKLLEQDLARRQQSGLRQPTARVGLIHRLDRDASGLLVFSKTLPAYDSLKSQFFHHTVDRVYHALVHGCPREPRGRIESRLVERADGTVHSTKLAGKGDRAVTDYEVVERRGRRTLVRLKLFTGRKHQIRVHLSEMNCAIAGDTVYAHGQTDSDGLKLMATQLAFDHPRSGERMSFELPVPESWQPAEPHA